MTTPAAATERAAPATAAFIVITVEALTGLVRVEP